MASIVEIYLILVLCFFGGVFGEHNHVSLEELIAFQSNFYNNLAAAQVSTKCKTSLLNIQQKLNTSDQEQLLGALKFFDASSKIPNGLLAGNYFDLGNYDECVNIHFDIENEEIYGKYCFGTIPIDISQLQSTKNEDGKLKIIGQDNIGLHLAYCLPHTCTNDDFTQIIPFSTFLDNYCYTKAEKRSYDTWDIIAIIILCVFLQLVLISTTYDIIIRYYDMKSGNPLLLAFSVWTNGKKIIQTSSGSDQLSCINGIKALSMVWVIYGHVNSNILTNAAIDNFQDTQSFMLKVKNMYIVAAPVSVDTFFAVGGLLLMYVFLKSLQKGVKFNLPMFYIHRYLRLTPALAILVLYNATLIRYMGDGPLWGTVEDSIKPCREYWWSTLLYIQNYVNPENTCSGQSWYLSVDMQLFVLTPIILIPMQRWPKFGLISLGLLAIAGVVVPSVVTSEMDLTASMGGGDMDEIMRYMKYYYFQTYARFGPYIIGMITGYIIFQLQKNPEFANNNIRNKKWLVLLLWVIAIGGLLACTYGGADVLTQEITDKTSRSIYNGLNRNAWAISVCLVVILCCTGCGGIINSFLSLPIFQLLSKLSYSMYLVHFTWVISTRLWSSKVSGHFGEMNIIHDFWGDFMITFIVSFVLCVVFESPMIIIEKALLGNHKNKPREEEKKKEISI